jgi:hypothetical protein
MYVRNQNNIYPKQSKKAKVDGYLRRLGNWARHSSSVGLPNIVRTRFKIMRLFWLLAFLAGIGFTMYYNIILLQQYLKYDTQTSTQTTIQTPLDFPAIKFCNLNVFDISYVIDQYCYYPMYKSNITRCFIEVFKCEIVPEATEGNIDIFARCLMNLMTDYDYFSDIGSGVIENIVDIFTQFGLKIDKMLLNCKYNGMTCNKSDFLQTWDNKYGLCYTFNSGIDANKNPIRNTSQTGQYSGLVLELVAGKLRKAIKT